MNVLSRLTDFLFRRRKPAPELPPHLRDNAKLWAREALYQLENNLTILRDMGQPVPIAHEVKITPPELPPHFEPTRALVRYSPPSGGKWVPVFDFARNRELQERGVGWQDYCAIEVWREDWAKPIAVFSSWLAQCNREYAIGMHWRPLAHARAVPTTWQ
jgi:hypothetical protein